MNVKTLRIVYSHSFKITTIAMMVFMAGQAFPPHSYCQIRSGAAFLKIMPGVRNQGLAGSVTAAIDEAHSLYANPAATAYLREHQWALSYTKWMADIYNLSFIYGRQMRTPLHRRMRLALGLNYQGVKEFDSTVKLQAPASAGDLLAVASIGFPLSFISDHIAVGSNAKYLRSQLDDFTTATYIVDAGILIRTRRFDLHNRLFKYGIFSAGLSLSQYGQALKFISYNTPLPHTLRAGAALNLGTHNGVQWQLSVDYQKVHDEIDRLSVGAELSWSYWLALRGGYDFNERLLSKLSFGFSIRLDDLMLPSGNIIPGRNSALRMDVAGLEDNEIFATSYKGGLNHYAIGPEKFELHTPVSGDTIKTDVVTLAWERSPDPDLYDAVRYVLLMERVTGPEPEKLLLNQFIEEVNGEWKDPFATVDIFKNLLFLVKDSTFAYNRKTDQVTHALTGLPPGDYYWTVLAYDQDSHFRIARDKIWRFHITMPDIAIAGITFEHSRWITESDTQGVVTALVTNKGQRAAREVAVKVTDSQAGIISDRILLQSVLPSLQPGDTLAQELLWRTPISGLHQIRATAYIYDEGGEIIPELNSSNNDSSAFFYTIPKGVFATRDTIFAYLLPRTFYDVPLVSRVFFNHMRAEILLPYDQESDWLYSPLDTLAVRLQRQRNLKIHLKGHADSVNDEPLTLARQRVEAVRQRLLELGVAEGQIPVDELAWEMARDRKITDNAGVHEERRHVKILPQAEAADSSEWTALIEPVPFKNVNEPPIPLPAIFASSVHGVVPLDDGQLWISSDSLSDIVKVGYAELQVDSVRWHHDKKHGLGWLNKDADYFIVLTDTFGRQFRTRLKRCHLGPKPNDMPIIVGLAEFNNPDPFPIIPWPELIKQLKLRLKYQADLRMRFVGHACGIEPRQINIRYSRFRAQRFQNQFLREVEKRKLDDLEAYQLITKRLDVDGTVGKGADAPFTITLDVEAFRDSEENYDPESYQKIMRLLESGVTTTKIEPFIYELKDGQIHLSGDNDTPIGRQVNRRIEIEFYRVK